MVDRGFRYRHHTVHEEHAVWHALLGPGDIAPSSSEFSALKMCPFSFYWTGLQDKFPNAPEEEYAACIGRLVFYRYLNPAIMYVSITSAIDCAQTEIVARPKLLTL